MRAIVTHQMILFFCVFFVGMLSIRLNILQRDGLPYIARLMSKILLPALIFSMIYFGASWEVICQSWIILLLTAGFFVGVSVLTAVTARLTGLSGERSNIFRFAFTFGNAGFVGAPLLAAILPETGGIYFALFSIVDQLLFWTWGIWLASADKSGQKLSFRRFLNPNLVSILLGFLAVAFRVQLPQVAQEVIVTFKNAVPAISMMYLGALFACSDWRTTFRKKEIYLGIIVKMVLLPVILGKLLLLTPLPEGMVSFIMLIAALPTMTVVPMIADMHGNEGEYAAGITAATLAASILTIPLVFALVF